jgi:probable phosphoglycerate mutase
MRLLLVRHGASEWNAVRRLQSQADLALSDLGREQARRLRPVTEALVPDQTISSDLVRAAETARLLGATDANLMPGLREIAVGS